MKRIISLIIFFICLASPSFSDELDSAADIWDAGNIKDNAFNGQQQISDEQFDKVMKAIKEKEASKKKFWWSKKKPDIKPLSPTPQYSESTEFAELESVFQNVNHSPTVMISVHFHDDYGKILEPGFYKLSNIKDEDGNYYLTLSQGDKVITRISAYQSSEDFAQNEINFAKILTVSDKKLRIIYGSLDLNLEAFLDIKN